jgi:adenosylcobinamide-GDP ribazoletransferase
VPDGLRLALTTFTVLPLQPGRVDRGTAGAAMAWAPAVGALLALVVACVLFASRILFVDVPGPLLPAVLAVTALALLTRGLHLDGLVDTVDGLAAHAPAPRALEIMRSPEVGPLGAAAVMLSLLVQVAALAACVGGHRGTESVVLAVVTGRLAVVHACRVGVPAARPDGLGALVAGSVRPWVAWAWTAAVVVEAVVYGRFDQDAGTLRGGLRAVLALALGLAVTTLLRRHVVRRIGGVTGDVLGALVEVGQAVVLVVMATELPDALRG